MNIEQLITLHKCGIYNRDKIEGTTVCGCFYCKKIFSPKEIKEWTDDGQTAICPYCGVDSIVCNDPNYMVTEEDLDMLHKYYFECYTTTSSEESL
jgi:hypothetical protein